MRRISDTISRLSALRSRLPGSSAGGEDRLSDLPSFGSNPGALRARVYIPDSLKPNAPLVLVLHGCTQTAAAYDHGSGWSQLADRHGFAVLYPEQQRANNANLCFNWFIPEDFRRDSGEALSIRQMIRKVVRDHSLDEGRIFVTGLSAGGAMAAAMLAAYPDVFAGGAIMAGLPYGAAATVPEAFDRMRGHGLPTEPQLQELMRGASRHGGPWPTVSIWHGTADQTVSLSNADAIVDQWRGVHQVGPAPSDSEKVDGATRRVWRDASGRGVIETYTIAGMGHGTALKTGGADGLGASGPFMLDVGISSTLRTAEFWQLTEKAAPARHSGADRAGAPSRENVREAKNIEIIVPTKKGEKAGAASPAGRKPSAPGGTGVTEVIESALRKAGLMR